MEMLLMCCEAQKLGRADWTLGFIKGPTRCARWTVQAQAEPSRGDARLFLECQLQPLTGSREATLPGRPALIPARVRK